MHVSELIDKVLRYQHGGETQALFHCVKSLVRSIQSIYLALYVTFFVSTGGTIAQLVKAQLKLS